MSKSNMRYQKQNENELDSDQIEPETLQKRPEPQLQSF